MASKVSEKDFKIVPHSLEEITADWCEQILWTICDDDRKDDSSYVLLRRSFTCRLNGIRNL